MWWHDWGAWERLNKSTCFTIACEWREIKNIALLIIEAIHPLSHHQPPAKSLCYIWIILLGSDNMGFPGNSSGKESSSSSGDPGLIPGSGRSPGKGKGSTLHYSCLDNSMDRGAWWAAANGGHKELGVTERLTLLLFTVTICLYLFIQASCPGPLHGKEKSYFWDILVTERVLEWGSSSQGPGFKHVICWIIKPCSHLEHSRDT